MILRTTSLLLAVLSVMTIPNSASAALQTFYTQSSFQSAFASLAVPVNQSLANFDSFSGSQGTSFSNSGFTFAHSTANPPAGMRILSSPGTTSSGNNSLGYDSVGFEDFTEGDVITITLPAGQRSIALNVITETTPSSGLGEFATLAITGGTATGTANTGAAPGSVINNQIFVPGSTTTKQQFLGFINDTPASTITTAQVTFTGQGLYRIDDVSIMAVPEPSSLALAAVAGLVGFARRRNRRS